MYTEKFRLNSLNTRFGVTNLSDTELDKLIATHSYEDLIDHHAKYLGRVYQDSNFSFSQPAGSTLRQSIRSLPGIAACRWSA